MAAGTYVLVSLASPIPLRSADRFQYVRTYVRTQRSDVTDTWYGSYVRT